LEQIHLFFFAAMETTIEATMETAERAYRAESRSEELSDYETERGKPMPSKRHSLIQTNIGTAIKNRYKRQYRTMSELSMRLHGEKFVPDLAVYPFDASDWSKEEIEMTLTPLLIVEIESPSQSTDEMKEKADKYFAAGVRSVWLVLPALAGVMVLHPESKSRFFSEGEIVDVVDDVLNIRIPVDEVFE
jgi:Uma2 family endonuclease